MIDDLSPSILIAKELAMTTNRICNVVTSDWNDDPFINKLVEKVKNENAILEQADNKTRSSEYTQLLKEKDNIRDFAFKAFREFVSSGLYRRTNNINKSAELIMEIIKKHGTQLYSSGYTIQSQKLNNLFSDLNEEKVKAAITKLKAEEYLNELKTAQTDFETMYKTKTTEEGQENIPQIREAKSKVGRYVNILLENVRVNEEMEPAKYKAMAERLDEIVKDVMSTARARKTRQENDGQEE